MTQGHGGTPAGWYPDPEGNGERWWNGMSWGELRSAPTAIHQPYPPQSYERAQPYGQSQPHGQSQPQQVQPYGPSQPQQVQSYGQQSEQPPQQQHQPQTARPDMHCVHCGWTDFQPADYQLINPRGTQPFNPDNLTFTASCLICRRCGFIHWFAAR